MRINRPKPARRCFNVHLGTGISLQRAGVVKELRVEASTAFPRRQRWPEFGWMRDASAIEGRLWAGQKMVSSPLFDVFFVSFLLKAVLRSLSLFVKWGVSRN